MNFGNKQWLQKNRGPVSLYHCNPYPPVHFLSGASCTISLSDNQPVALVLSRIYTTIERVIKTNLWNSMNNADRDYLFKTAGDNLPVKRVVKPKTSPLLFYT